MKKIIAGIIIVVLLAGIVGCSKKAGNSSADKETTKTAEAVTTEVLTTEEPTTEEPTTEEPTTETPTTVAPTEPPTEAPVTAYSLLNNAKLNPTKTGYEELDSLIANLIATHTTSDMSNYSKVWALYLYLVDNITYSRGMDANAGAYSSSDVATTPKQVLWATDLLNSGMGCCYNYSAAFAYIMRTLGYEVQLVTGQVPKYGGGTTPHCWVYVILNGNQYIFDPDLEMNYYTRDMKNHVEGDPEPSKERFFGVPFSNMSYFYSAEQYY